MAARTFVASAPKPSLQLRLIGELEVAADGVPAALPASRRTRALLGYLVATGRAHSRQALCDLLWDGPDDPRAALRWSLTKLRGVVDAPDAVRLVADRERVAFLPLGAVVDIERAQRLLEAGCENVALPALEEAAQLLAGEFLGGLELPACYRFHQWCMAERERHGALRRDVLATLVERLKSEPERALKHARALLAFDPLAEAAHANVVRLIAAAGRYGAAEEHYHYARDLLRREVSLPPGGLLDSAIRMVRRQLTDAGAAAPALQAAVVTDASPGLDIPPVPLLVGRGVERAAIDRALEASTASAAMLLFLGEPGIGKTRVLDDFCERANAGGFRVLRGRCFEAEAVRPYGLWVDALRGASLASVSKEVAAAAAPLLDVGLSPVAAPSGDRSQLFSATALLVRSLAVSSGLAIALDDLQWIDESSAALLHFLARTPDLGGRLVLAGAARSGEIDDNPWARGLVQSLAREQRIERLPLAPLDPDQAAALVNAVLGTVDASLALGEAGGNPLYLLELVRARGRAHNPADRSLDALVADRLEALGLEDRETLAWAAAMGRQIQPELMAHASGLGVADILARCERLERRGLMKPTGDDHFDFSHDLIRHAVYRGLSGTRRKTIHRQIALALDAARVRDPRLHGDLVRHATIAEDRLLTARACLAAGEHCLRVFANRQAIAVAEQGIAQLPAIAAGAERIQLTIGLLKLRVVADASPGTRQGRQVLAAQLEHAVAAAEALGLHADAAAGLHILSWLREQSNDIERTLATTLEAERATRSLDQATRCQQLANTGRCLLEVDSDVPRARDLLDEAARLAATLNLRFIEIDWGLALLARVDGEMDVARDRLGAAVSLARLQEDRWREYECLVWLAQLAFEDRQFDAVCGFCELVVQASRRMWDTGAPFAEVLDALARLHRGEPVAAALTAGLAALRDADDKAHLAYALNAAGDLELVAGTLDAARAMSEEALDLARAVNRPTEMAVATAMLARVAARTGDVSRVRALLASLDEAGASGRLNARALGASMQAEAEGTGIPTLDSTVRREYPGRNPNGGEP